MKTQNNMWMPALAIAATTALGVVGCENGKKDMDDQSMNHKEAMEKGEMKGDKMMKGEVSQMDKQFVQKAASGGMFDVKSSEAAKAKLVDEVGVNDTYDFATMMISDHTAANAKLMAIAKSEGIEAPKEMMPPQQMMYDKLTATKDNKAFEKMYRDQQAKSHKDSVALFEKAAKECTNPELKAFAAKTLPLLKSHQLALTALPKI